MLLNTIKTIAVVMLLSAGSALTAVAQSTPVSDSFQMAFYPAKEPLKLWFVLVKPVTDTNTKVELINSQNQTLYVGGISRKDQRVSQLFDLSDVTDGTYKIRVTTGKEQIEKTFQVQTPVVNEPAPQRLLTFTDANKLAVSGM